MRRLRADAPAAVRAGHPDNPLPAGASLDPTTGDYAVPDWEARPPGDLLDATFEHDATASQYGLWATSAYGVLNPAREDLGLGDSIGRYTRQRLPCPPPSPPLTHCDHTPQVPRASSPRTSLPPKACPMGR